ncbi:MAG: hypothetical protein EAX96_20445 [Candidatus Lokiarchaeota archaeon]|nr:hypothetical protein [Candidatus Lokiarchaeota archaeon]
MSEFLENLIGSCVIDPDKELSLFWTLYCIDSAEFNSELEELEIFGDLQSTIISSFKMIGFPIVASQINIFSFYNLEEQIPIPQSIMFSYYPETPHVFFFVISSKIPSIDKIMELTRELHFSVKDSMNLYKVSLEKGIMNENLKDFLKDKVFLQHYPAYLDYIVFNTPSNYIDNLFNMNFTPIKLSFARNSFPISNPLDPTIEEEIHYENISTRNLSEYPKILPVFNDFVEMLRKVIKEGIIKFGNLAGRDYRKLSVDFSSIVFEIDKKNQGYLLYQGVHEPFGLRSDNVKLNSFYCLSYGSNDPTTQLTTAINIKRRLSKVLQKSMSINSKEIPQFILEMLKKQFPLMKWEENEK